VPAGVNDPKARFALLFGDSTIPLTLDSISLEVSQGCPGECVVGTWTCPDENHESVCLNGAPCNYGSTSPCNPDQVCVAGKGCQPCGHAQEPCCAAETCLVVTDKCSDGICVPSGCVDKDGDGFPDVACGGTDCNDAVWAIHPGAVELCNGIDDNCNGPVDETFDLSSNFANCGSCGHVCSPGESCVNGVCVPPLPTCVDADGDGHAALGSCPGADDCDDSDPKNFPGNIEVCDSKDNNCNGVVDDAPQGVGAPCKVPQKFGVCADGLTACTNGAITCAQTTFPSSEVCDGLDNDCNGVVDDGVTTTYYKDADGDGYGDPAKTSTACTAPPGYVAQKGDCDDADPNVNPSVPEICDGKDNNCNNIIDEGCSCVNGATQPCYTGPPSTLNIGVCHGGTATCNVSGRRPPFGDPRSRGGPEGGVVSGP